MSATMTIELCARKIADSVGTGSDPDGDGRMRKLSSAIAARNTGDHAWRVDGLAIYRERYGDQPADVRDATSRIAFVGFATARQTWAEAANVALHDPSVLFGENVHETPAAYLAAAEWLAAGAESGGQRASGEASLWMTLAVQMLTQAGYRVR